jgi:hypothetical protein
MLKTYRDMNFGVLKRFVRDHNLENLQPMAFPQTKRENEPNVQEELEEQWRDVDQSQQGSYFTGINGLRRQLRNGVSLDQVLAEAKLANATLGCFTAFATNLQSSESRYLSSIPFGVKECMFSREFRIGCGTTALQASNYDSTVVARLKQHGAVPIATTLSSQMTTLPTGRNIATQFCRNPYNTEHDCGGSSAGSAAAVAAGLVPFALGSGQRSASFSDSYKTQMKAVRFEFQLHSTAWLA